MMIAGKSFITKENPVAVLGILMIGNLINGMFGLSGSVINGLGKSKFMLKMNIVSLVFAITMNYLLIPLFGIAGAALSSMSYQILQCVWMNVYLVKMGYWPYKKSLFVQGSLILILALFYIGLNQGISLSVASKIVTYSIAVLVILAVFYFQGLFGKKYSRKKSR